MSEPISQRERFGRAFQFRTTIHVAMTTAPDSVKAGLKDKQPVVQKRAKDALVEIIAVALERRFAISWDGSDDLDPDALEPQRFDGPAFQGKG